MNILGIHGNVLNPAGVVNESSAALVKDGILVAAVAEERISRQKVDGRFPTNAINNVLELGNISIDEIDEVAVTTIHPYLSSKRYLKSALAAYKDTGVWIGNKIRSFGWYTIYNKFKAPKDYFVEVNGKKFKVNFNDHHDCHAAGAYYAAPFDNSLIITLDGGGDGLDGAAYFGSKGKMERFIEIPHFQSPGTMYSAITYDLGFKRHRHEGKITGLAAYGNPDPSRLGLENLISYSEKKHRFISKGVAKHHRNLIANSPYFYPLLEKHSKEDLAAVTQQLFEQEIVKFVHDAVNLAGRKGFNIENVCLAGGCFANVKANQRIFETGHFKNIFVFPAMGDDGLSVGAAYLKYYSATNQSEKRENSAIKDTYLGAEFTNEEVEKSLKEFNLKYKKLDNIEDEVGSLLADGKIVARFNGRMEYGPRALGNRSILGAPFDPKINDWLNKKLNRTEFMPFAPSMLVDKADDYLVNFDANHTAAYYMTITYDIKEGMKEKIPAVVHIDNTARPQLVSMETNKSYYKIIESFYKATGVPVVLNTSFNMHEEPIVYTPSDAIRGFLDGKLDVLAINDFLVLQED